MSAVNEMGKGKQNPHKTRGGKQKIKGMTLGQLIESMSKAGSSKERDQLGRRADYIVRVHGAET